MLTRHDLQRFIDDNRIAAQVLPMTEDTPTVPDAARALGVEEEQIIKSRQRNCYVSRGQRSSPSHSINKE